MDWDAERQTFHVGEVQRALLALRVEIEALARTEDVLQGESARELREVLMTALKATDRKTKTMMVANLTMVPLFALADHQINLMRLMAKLCLVLDGDATALSGLVLQPTSPFSKEAVSATLGPRLSLEDAASFVAARGKGGV